jgi:hypothetical protein
LQQWLRKEERRNLPIHLGMAVEAVASFRRPVPFHRSDQARGKDQPVAAPDRCHHRHQEEGEEDSPE